MIDSFSSQIKVAVRVRPTLPCDYKLSRQKGIKSEVCVSPKSDGETISLVKDLYHSKDFRYNQVFGHLETQQDVYEKGCQQLVSEFTNGYNACLLCYGQSGTGKTFTMFGKNEKNWKSLDNAAGVMQHSLIDIFKYMETCRAENKTAKLYVSFYEIYLECVRDLLIPSKVRGQKVNLNIRECPDRGTYIEGLAIFEVQDFDSMYELIHKAVARRVTGDQKMNATSSRSHAIVRLVLEHEVDADEYDTDSINSSMDENPILSIIGGRGRVRKNIFTFGDLAGSERLSKSGSSSSGMQLKEAQNINKSISALGNCVQALAFASNKREKGGITASHIPFRDAKLTRLLADALSGNTKTYFIATVGPSMHSYTETLSTLTFASRAASVKKMVVKEKASPDVFTDLSREMFDWQWPAVYKKSETKQKISLDDTDWTYDTRDDEIASKSQVASKTLTMNDFLTKSAPEPEPVNTSVTTPKKGRVGGQGGAGELPDHITIYQNDIHSQDQKSKSQRQAAGSRVAAYQDSEPGASTRWSPPQTSQLTPERQGNNSLLFELASEAKDFNSVYQPNVSPRNYHDEEKEWTQGDVNEKDFLDSNLYLSFPPLAIPLEMKNNTSMTSLRKPPPIPPTHNTEEMIHYEVDKEESLPPQVLKSALKITKPPPSPHLNCSIIDELDTLSGEIKSLRENLADMDRSTTSSAQLLPSSRNTARNEMEEICFDDLATSTDDFFSSHHNENQEPVFSSDNSNSNSHYHDQHHNSDSGAELNVDTSTQGNTFKDIVFYTTDDIDGSPLHTLERSIISCAGDGADDDLGGFVPRDHTLLPDFSLQDFDDELDKINLENNLNLHHPPSSKQTTPSRSRKKEIRFDMKSTPGYDASEIIDISLNTSSMKRYRLPPPPPTPHPSTLPVCDECGALKTQVADLKKIMLEQKNEIDLLKECIHLNDLQSPAVSVKDGSSGVFF